MGEIWLKRGALETAASCGVENKLKAIKCRPTARKIEKEIVTVVDLGSCNE